MDALKPLARTLLQAGCTMVWPQEKQKATSWEFVKHGPIPIVCMYGPGHVQVRDMAPQLEMNRAE
jgi:hypothetical protein